MDLTPLDPYGRSVIVVLGGSGGLAVLTSLTSVVASLVSVWTMQRTTADATWKTRAGKALWVQRLALGLLALSLALNALTPFITPDPPWLSSLPLNVAVALTIFIFGLIAGRANR